MFSMRERERFQEIKYMKCQKTSRNSTKKVPKPHG